MQAPHPRPCQTIQVIDGSRAACAPFIVWCWGDCRPWGLVSGGRDLTTSSKSGADPPLSFSSGRGAAMLP